MTIVTMESVEKFCKHLFYRVAIGEMVSMESVEKLCKHLFYRVAIEQSNPRPCLRPPPLQPSKN